MKLPAIILISITIMSTACNTAKKGTRSIVSSTPIPAPATTTPETTTDNPFRFMRPDGTHAPGNEELAAMQAQYSDITLEKLTEGYVLYTQGACINCHGAQNIYDHEETQWKIIVDDMAQRAGISDTQKNAVYKYVLAIKATQPK